MRWDIGIEGALTVIAAIEVGGMQIAAQEKCTIVSALVVAKNAKYHSSQQVNGQSTAKNAGQIEDHQGRKTKVKEDMPKNAVREALLVEKN